MMYNIFISCTGPILSVDVWSFVITDGRSCVILFLWKSPMSLICKGNFPLHADDEVPWWNRSPGNQTLISHVACFWPCNLFIFLWMNFICHAECRQHLILNKYFSVNCRFCCYFWNWQIVKYFPWINAWRTAGTLSQGLRGNSWIKWGPHIILVLFRSHVYFEFHCSKIVIRPVLCPSVP